MTDKKFSLEDKWKDIDPVAAAPETTPEREDEPIEIQPQVEFGIHIMMLTNGKPHAEITGTPSYSQLLRLVNEVQENMRGELLAEKVVAKLASMRAPTRKIL